MKEFVQETKPKIAKENLTNNVLSTFLGENLKITCTHRMQLELIAFNIHYCQIPLSFVGNEGYNCLLPNGLQKKFRDYCSFFLRETSLMHFINNNNRFNTYWNARINAKTSF